MNSGVAIVKYAAAVGKRAVGEGDGAAVEPTATCAKSKLNHIITIVIIIVWRANVTAKNSTRRATCERGGRARRDACFVADKTAVNAHACGNSEVDASVGGGGRVISTVCHPNFGDSGVRASVD